MKNKINWKEFLASFSTNQFRRGGYSFVICAVILAAVVVLNLVMGVIPSAYTHLDVTGTGLYTLDEQTTKLLKNLDEDVTLTYLVTEASRDATLEEYLSRYESLSSHIQVRRIDPETNPAYVQSFTESLSDGSVIVEGEKRNKVIPSSNLYSYDEDSYYAYLYGYSQNVEVSFAGEAELTSALDYVTSDELPVMYTVSGHGEYALSTTWTQYLAKENVEVRDLNLLSAGSVPADCDVLWICTPTSDYTKEEADAVIEYLYQGGRMLLFTDYIQEKLDHFASIMRSYGLELADGFVVEGDAGHTANQQPYYLLPNITSHAVTDPTIEARLPLLISMPQGIVASGTVRSSIETVPLLSTSDAAYSKLGGLTINTWEKEDGDLDGPFDVAVAVQEAYNDVDTRIVWSATSSVLDDSFDSYTGGADSDFVLNALGWVCEHENAIAIRTKDFTRQYLNMDSLTALIWAGILCVVLPLGCLITGFVIWLKRRNK